MKIEWGAILAGAVIGAAAGYVMGHKAKGGNVSGLLAKVGLKR